MFFPQDRILKEFTNQIKILKDLENSRSDKDSEILSKLINKEITAKEAKKELKDNKLLSSSKKIDEQAIYTLVKYNNAFSSISNTLSIARIPKYSIEQHGFLNKLFSSKDKDKEIKIEKQKEPEVKKQKTKKEDKKKETNNKSSFKFFKNIFSTKHKTKEKPKEVTKPVVTTPIFEPPKELLPENYQVLIPGFSYAFIKEDENSRTYVVAEPELTDKEHEILDKVKNSLINKISLADLNDESQMYGLIDKIFDREKIEIDKKQKEKIIYYVIRQVSGLDRIEPLMHDPLIEDIECDGMGISIYIVHRKYGHIATNIKFDKEEKLQQFIIKMAHLCKNYVSYASPLLDSILPDGSRVNAILTSNVSTRGPTFTIRKFPSKPLTTVDVVKNNTITSDIVAYIWTLLEFKKNFILIGPTAGGKTTLLNVISSFIPPAERVVSIEDTREINLLLDNWIPQVTRPGFGPPDSSGKRYGEVTMNDLLKESFRQRPDYLIIGEVRGEEISLMFQGMASGHCSLSTVHSRSVEGLMTRLTTPPISLDPSLITSLDVVIVTGFSGTGEAHREVKELDEIKGYDSVNKKIEYNAIYKSTDKYKEKSATETSDLITNKLSVVYNSDLLKEIATNHNLDLTKLSDVITKRKEFIDSLMSNPPKDYIEFNSKLREYKKKENFIV